MLQTVRYQVFVSSTYTDLATERAEVLQAVWEMDCIPTGMEAFVASNESQWEVIKRVINECDYYVLIIGGRYGSITEDGISYTEKEYRYAKELAIPVLAFVHSNPDEIPVGKSEKDSALQKKLTNFRLEVTSTHPVRFWSTASELGGVVSRSLNREIKINPRLGWIRNDGNSPIALLERVNKLSEENQRLQAIAAQSREEEIILDLEQGQDEVTLRGTTVISPIAGGRSTREDWHAEASWDDIFKDIGPALINEASETVLKDLIARFAGWASYPTGYQSTGSSDIFPETWNEVVVQFRALGLIDKGTKKRGVNDSNSYWRITPKGDNYLVNLMARKRKEMPSKVVGKGES